MAPLPPLKKPPQSLMSDMAQFMDKVASELATTSWDLDDEFALVLVTKKNTTKYRIIALLQACKDWEPYVYTGKQGSELGPDLNQGKIKLYGRHVRIVSLEDIKKGKNYGDANFI